MRAHATPTSTSIASRSSRRERTSSRRAPAWPALASWSGSLPCLGLLKLTSPNWHGGRSSWSEGPRGALERKPPAFFDELERRAEQDDIRVEQRRHEAEQRRQRELALIEQRRLAQIEAKRAERLAADLNSRRITQDARAYAADLHKRAETLDPGRGNESSAGANGPRSGRGSKTRSPIRRQSPDSIHPIPTGYGRPGEISVGLRHANTLQTNQSYRDRFGRTRHHEQGRFARRNGARRHSPDQMTSVYGLGGEQGPPVRPVTTGFRGPRGLANPVLIRRSTAPP